jgi:hypothetical protein
MMESVTNAITGNDIPEDFAVSDPRGFRHGTSLTCFFIFSSSFHLRFFIQKAILDGILNAVLRYLHRCTIFTVTNA